MKNNSTDSSLILYQTEDGQTKIEIHLIDKTVWLSQDQMAEFFDKDKRTISEHIRNIFKERELLEKSVVRNFRTTASDSKNYEVLHYNLDVIISVGYRVKSHRGTQFRIWATARLKEFLIKGFVLDDQKLKRLGGDSYFEELLSRIRDIRSSEKVFWRKVLDIYATSIDYDPSAETSVEIAKNYLSADELNIPNRLVSIYLDFAELQALDHKPMYMKNWMIF